MSTELSQARELVRAGRLSQAQTLLAHVLKTDPKSEEGWWLLSQALTDPARQADCLRRVIALNPQRADARTRLQQLTASTGSNAVAATPSRPPESPRPAARRAANAEFHEELRDSMRQAPEAKPATPAFQSRQPEETAAYYQGYVSREPLSEPGIEAPKPQLPPPARQPAQPARSGKPGWLLPALVAGGVCLVLLMMCGVGLFVFQTGRPAALPTRALSFAEVTLTPTPLSSFPTLPPEWTATPTLDPRITPTATITRTPLPTPTFRPPNPTVVADMQIIRQQVADVRGLPPKEEVASYTLSRYNLDKTLEALLIDEDTRASLETDKRVLAALGLVKPTYDMVKYALQSQGQGLGGFYIPWTKQLFVIGDKFTGMERYVFSHEYTHALTDQHFDIAAAGVYPTCADDEQRCQAMQALIEGDASLSMDLWLRQYGRPQDFQDLYAYRPYYDKLPEEFSPPFFSVYARFPYSEGQNFVEYLYERGNWAEVNKAYTHWPASTEQILHPEKYIQGEAPVQVESPELGEALGDGWRLLRRNSLGEFMTFLILGYSADYAAQLYDDEAFEAAEGWGGDTYQVYVNEAANQTAVAVHWAWDTATDARQADQAFAHYLKELYRGGALNSAAGQCWSANNQVSCLFLKGKETLWLTAPDADTLDRMLAQFANFP